MRLDLRGILRLGALAAWAALFDWLWLGGEASRYVGSRTAWVVPFGAIALTTATLLQLASLRRRRQAAPEALTAREVAGLVALVAPVLALVVIPSPTLGSLAVDKKQANRAPLPPTGPKGAELSLVDVAAASESPDYARIRPVKPGSKAVLVGFVSGRRGNGDLEVARFMASCCAADAIPYVAVLRATGLTDPPAKDQWIEARGVVRRSPAGNLYVAARPEAVRATAEPGDVYFSR